MANKPAFSLLRMIIGKSLRIPPWLAFLVCHAATRSHRSPPHILVERRNKSSTELSQARKVSGQTQYSSDYLNE